MTDADSDGSALKLKTYNFVAQYYMIVLSEKKNRNKKGTYHYELFITTQNTSAFLIKVISTQTWSTVLVADTEATPAAATQAMALRDGLLIPGLGFAVAAVW